MGNVQKVISFYPRFSVKAKKKKKTMINGVKYHFQ
jgi:hypothetical protein